ncbi:MAG: sigma-70 family RNA polymerase sigma factor [Myxococcota bacterium]
MNDDAATFEGLRSQLHVLAYRMLGDNAAAQDIVQNAWLRWQRREVEVESPRPYLIKTVMRLCLNEMESARFRKEHAFGARLPEPVRTESDTEDAELYEGISMAFLVMLQRLTPAERAVLLLHEFFGYAHAEIAEMLGKSAVASRQLLRRAKAGVTDRARTRDVSPEQHREFLRAFAAAATAGDQGALLELLSEDTILVVDAGPGGATFGRTRNLPAPVRGATKVAAFVASVAPQGSGRLRPEVCELNGQPALIVAREGGPHSAVSLSIRDGRIDGVFIHADPARLRALTRMPPRRPR